jgi:hypothetical protein
VGGSSEESVDDATTGDLVTTGSSTPAPRDPETGFRPAQLDGPQRRQLRSWTVRSLPQLILASPRSCHSLYRVWLNQPGVCAGRPSDYLALRPLAIALGCLLPLTSCLDLDNPFDDDVPPPSGATGDAEASATSGEAAATCQQAIELASTSCFPPANLEITVAGGWTEVIGLDDPSVTVAANVVVAQAVANTTADFFARVFIQEPSCSVQCIYPCTASSQNMCAEMTVAGGCIACTEEPFTLEECADFVAACDPSQPPTTEADATGVGETSSSGGTTQGS